jgi:hypothetical protein
MLISVLAGAKTTSPSVTTTPFNDPVCITPSPTMTKKTEGPGTAGKTVDAPWGRIQRSTSNSSKGGRYLVTYEFTGIPCRISGKPCSRDKYCFFIQVFVLPCSQASFSIKGVLVSFRRVGKDYRNFTSFLAPTIVKLQLAQHQFTPFKKGRVRICLSTSRSVRTLIDSILYNDQDS